MSGARHVAGEGYFMKTIEVSREQMRRALGAEPRARAKHNNRKVAAGGFVFDSIAEYHRYQSLRLEEQAGLITGLVVHPSYELQAAFTDRTGKKHRAICYEPDLSYFADDKLVVEEVKGYMTQVASLKIKLFLNRYKDIDFRIIKA